MRPQFARPCVRCSINTRHHLGDGVSLAQTLLLPNKNPSRFAKTRVTPSLKPRHEFWDLTTTQNSEQNSLNILGFLAARETPPSHNMALVSPNTAQTSSNMWSIQWDTSLQFIKRRGSHQLTQLSFRVLGTKYIPKYRKNNKNPPKREDSIIVQGGWDDNRLPRMLGCLFGSSRGRMLLKIAQHGAKSSLYKFLLSSRRKQTSKNRKGVLGCGLAMHMSNVSSTLSNVTPQWIFRKHGGKPYKEVGCHLRSGGCCCYRLCWFNKFKVTTLIWVCRYNIHNKTLNKEHNNLENDPIFGVRVCFEMLSFGNPS